MKTTDLRHGNISAQLIRLAMPLLFGNILQQFYNTTDSLIIGHFLGENAFASTGISGSVMNLFIFIINGFCVGLSVIFAQSYGRGDRAHFRQEFFLSLLTGLGISALISIGSLVFLNPVLHLIKTPDLLISYCGQYLTIILLGLFTCFLYNFFSTILRSVGDTFASLLVLFIAILLNIGLDYLMVGFFALGISGAALATVIAQFFSAIFCFFYLRKKYPELICGKADCRFSLEIIIKTLRFGLVSALHQSSLYIGKILVQGAVNTLGTEGIAAYTATMRIEGIINSFGDSGNQSLSIFVSQNYGAGEKERVRKGFRTGLRLLVLLCLVISAIMFLTSNLALGLFLSQSSQLALDYGNAYLKIIAVFYVLCFIGNAFVGYFRGVGNVMIPFLGTTLHLTLRVILSWMLVARMGLSAVALATAAGWMLVVCFHTWNYFKIRK